MRKLLSTHNVAILALGLALVLAIGGATTALGNGKGAATASGPFAAVQIKVVDKYSGQPIAGARVQLYNNATGYNVTSRTGTDGVATFLDVPYFDTYYRAYLVKNGWAKSIRLLTVDEPFESFTQALEHFLK